MFVKVLKKLQLSLLIHYTAMFAVNLIISLSHQECVTVSPMLRCNSRFTQHSLSVRLRYLTSRLTSQMAIFLKWSSVCLSYILFSVTFTLYQTKQNSLKYFLFCNLEKKTHTQARSCVRSLCRKLTQSAHTH